MKPKNFFRGVMVSPLFTILPTEILARTNQLIVPLFVLFGVILARPSDGHAQTATFHLHVEPSATSGLLQLKTIGPDVSSAAFTSISLKNKRPGEYVIKEFDTQSGVPSASGVIPAGSTISFTLYMRKTADFGNMASKAKVYLNNSMGPLLCTGTAVFALTTTLTPFTFTCTTSTAVTMATSDRLYLWTGIELTAKPGKNVVQAELDIEGVLDEAADSKLIVPLPGASGPPIISGLSPSSGPIGTSVTISGSSFGAEQGTSTVTFNGASAAPTSWSSTQIVVPVPAGATTGPVVVTVGSAASNEVTFTVGVPPAIGFLSPTGGLRGTVVTVNGSGFGSAQGASTVTFNGVAAVPSSWSDTSIVAPVPSSATTGSVIVTVDGLASNGVTFTVFGTGAMTGTVTRALDSAPVSGATVEALQSGVVKASTVTANQGGYSLSSLLSGTYDLRVTTAGFTEALHTGISVNDYTNTMINFALDSASSNTTVLYHLHAEDSATNSLLQLNSVGPDTVATSLYTADLRNKKIGEYLIQAFDTQAGIPSRSGTIPSGSTVSFTFGMRQTAEFGTMMPRAKLYLNNASGALLCAGTASSPLTTTLNTFTFTCVTTADISVSASDRFYLWSGVSVTAKPGHNSVQAELDIEGTLNGDTDSHITVPLPLGVPALSSLSATSGRVGTAITIRGLNFGPTQAGSIVTFNGTPAAPNGWSDTAINTVVPAGATTGPVVVTVGGVAGNGLFFYVDDVAPGVVATVAGTGTAGFNGDGGPATSAQLDSPRGVAMDGQSNLLIADYNKNRIRKVDSTGIISTVAGSYDLPLCCLDGDPAVQAYLANPIGVATDRFGNLFIADSQNNRIRKVDASGIIWTVASNCFAQGVTTDLQGNVFFTCRSTVLKLDTAGVISTIAGNGISGYSGDGGPATAAQVNRPGGVAVDSQGNLFIADFGDHRIRKISPDGIITTVAGTGTAGFSGDGGPATAAQLNTPYGIAVDESGNLFIDDTGNSRIRKVTFTGIITTVAGTGGQGYGGDGGAASDATFNFATGIAVIGQDMLFIADAQNHRVRKIGGGPFPNAPVVDSISTLSGAVGSAVTIFGSNFEAAQGSSIVTFNGTLATTTSWSDTQIVATVPAGASTGSIVVTVAGQTSNGVVFTVPLYINTISPASGAIGTIVTVTGSGFGSLQGSSTLTVNGTSAIPTSWADAKIVTPIPPGASTGPVVVTVNGQPSNGVTFAVIPPPLIDSLSPSSDPPDSLVTISGSNFGVMQIDSVVTFNSLVATVDSWSDTSIVARVPLNATTGPVVVTVSGTQSNGVVFTVLPGPNIDSLSPYLGVSGTPVTIAGANFGSSQGNSLVHFNGLTATPTSWSNSSIAVPVPMGADTGPVTVTVGGRTSNAVTFTIPLRIDLPAHGSVVNRPDTLVMGHFSGIVGDISVKVNGKFAMVNGQTFALNDVDLVVGQNTITAELQSDDGTMLTTSIIVQTDSQALYTRVTADVRAGLSPVTGLLNLEGVVSAQVTESRMTVNTTDFGVTAFPTQLTMTGAGMRLVTVTTLTSDNTVYQAQYAISVLDPVVMGTFLGLKWTGMQEAFLAGNVDLALTYFTSQVQDRYRTVFTDLQTQLPQIFSSLEGFHLLSMNEEMAEAEALRTENDVTVSYPVLFSLDENGFWKFKGF